MVYDLGNPKLNEPVKIHSRNAYHRIGIRLMVIALLMVTVSGSSIAQGTITLFGDIKIDDKASETRKPQSLSLILYNLAGNVVARQTVVGGIRYRFNNVRIGEYDLAIEVETTEIARVHIVLSGIPGSDFRHDLELEWKPTQPAARIKASTISAADAYKRTSANASLFERAQAAVDKKKYDEASTLFKRIVETDPQDFQAWTELGTTYLLQRKSVEAETAYLKATEVRPTFVLAFLNLGRLRSSEKKFEEAISPLLRVIDLQPESAEANFLLGEAYLQLKKGSKAVPYLSEAARLGKFEGYLRLATLYNAAGMKDKAAEQYEDFLRKNPDYPDRKKLEQYIEANKPNKRINSTP